jgi:hypothetical protein
VAPVKYQNEEPPQTPWPPAGPWIYFEVIQTETTLRGVGLPGNQTWLTVGHIFIHVFAPKGFGLADHLALAGNTKVICYGPSVQGGGSDSDDGNWFGVTVAIPFEFYFTA